VNSRPKSSWLDERGFVVGIAKIEVSTKDVIRTLCAGPSGVSSTKPRDLSHTRQLPEASLVNETAAKPLAEAAAEPVAEAAAEPVIEAIAEPAVEVGTPKRLTIGEETRATVALAQELEKKPEMSKAEAKQFLSDMRLPLDGRPFQRVWANARVRAGLPGAARPGPKRKSPR
jgi:hypothetical protein